MSIAKRQAQLLQENYLSKIGSTDRGIKHAASALIEVAAELISDAQDNLQNDGNVASGSLSSSIRAEEVEIKGNSMEIPILANSYWKYIDGGVKGYKTKGKGKYQFSKKIPPVAPILAWVRRRGIRAEEFGKYNVTKSKGEKKDEGLRRKIKKSDNFKSLAYAIAYSIRNKGIKPTNFMSKAVKKAEAKMKNSVMKGFKIDVLETIKDEFNNP